MIYKKIILACLVFALVITHISCKLFASEDEQNDTEPIYTPDIVWTLETKCVWPYSDELRYEQYLYIVESTYRYSNLPDEFNIAKIDLQTGKYEWRSPIVAGVEDSSVIKSNDNLFIQADNGLLYCFNDADGALRATIKLTDGEMSWWGKILAYKEYLYWGSSTKNLMRFDTQKINFSQPPDVAQSLSPKSIWSGIWSIGAMPIIDNDIIYILTANGKYYAEESYSTLAAIDASTNAVEWEKNFTFNEEGFPIGGKTNQPLQIIGDNIYVIDYAIGCYNKNTGTKIYEERQTLDDLMHEVSLEVSIFAPGVTYSNGRFYYVTSSHSANATSTGRPEKYNKNIICINAKNGKYVWGDMPPRGVTLGTTPVIINGKCYVLSDMGLRVYNANTGKLIGVDKTIGTLGEDRPHQYNDMFIYVDVDRNNRVGLLTAIRAK